MKGSRSSNAVPRKRRSKHLAAGPKTATRLCGADGERLEDDDFTPCAAPAKIEYLALLRRPISRASRRSRITLQVLARSQATAGRIPKQTCPARRPTPGPSRSKRLFRYSFIVMDLHHLLLSGLPAHSGLPPTPDIFGAVGDGWNNCSRVNLLIFCSEHIQLFSVKLRARTYCAQAKRASLNGRAETLIA
jgi:hypothetical protein